ncbi:hypothetical protein [Wielerella bovis]|nr:hypothetical protein [Wielerella bovis]
MKPLQNLFRLPETSSHCRKTGNRHTIALFSGSLKSKLNKITR